VPNEDTDECSHYPNPGIGEAEEPRRNFVYASRRSYPDAKRGGRQADPPATRKESDGETASEDSNEGHRSFPRRRGALP
jgi:hypothetical protein